MIEIFLDTPIELQVLLSFFFVMLIWYLIVDWEDEE